MHRRPQWQPPYPARPSAFWRGPCQWPLRWPCCHGPQQTHHARFPSAKENRKFHQWSEVFRTASNGRSKFYGYSTGAPRQTRSYPAACAAHGAGPPLIQWCPSWKRDARRCGRRFQSKRREFLRKALPVDFPGSFLHRQAKQPVPTADISSVAPSFSRISHQRNDEAHHDPQNCTAEHFNGCMPHHFF